MGEIQIEILQSLLKDRFDLEVTFGTGNILYKETIADTVEGVGHFEPLRHYAEVHLLLEPLERAQGWFLPRIAAKICWIRTGSD
jgi:translation elongation factor EF-G